MLAASKNNNDLLNSTNLDGSHKHPALCSFLEYTALYIRDCICTDLFCPFRILDHMYTHRARSKTHSNRTLYTLVHIARSHF